MSNEHSALQTYSAQHTLPTLNTSLIDDQYARASNAKDVSKAMIRLSAAFGEPYREDAQLTKQMELEWIKALALRSARTIEMAVDYWVATKTKWPKVAELIELADGYLEQQVKSASANHNVHEARVKLPPTYHGFVLHQSPLRSNLTWYKWLQSKHPMVEHSYFADAKFAEYEHIIVVRTAFVKDYILIRYAEELERALGRKINIRVAK